MPRTDLNKERDAPLAVVTGAANGLGLGLATVLGRRGMSLVLADIESDALSRAADGLRAAGHSVATSVVDVTDEQQVSTFGTDVLTRHGHVDVLCLNAGVTLSGRCWELSVADWRWVYDVNVFANVYAMRAFLPAMVARNDGRVVFTVSNSAVTTIPLRAPYVSSKHALLAIAETLQRELQACGSDVRVSAVLPGPIRSTMADSVRNRPAAYGTAVVPDDVRAAARAFLESHGADPVDMADHVLRQVLDDDRFYVFTDPDDLEPLRRRTRGIEAGRPLAAAPTDVPGS